MADINNLEDIKLLVNTFYGKVRENELLGPIFEKVISNNWEAHLEKMYRFWQTILLEEYTYSGRPFPPHAKLPITGEHFDTWLKIWNATVDDNFTGEKANEAKWRGYKMAQMFISKIEYYRGNNAQPLI